MAFIDYKFYKECKIASPSFVYAANEQRLRSGRLAMTLK